MPSGVDVRPTAARVRGAIFDRLQFIVPGTRMLDLFAGSGAMGFEAVSRGADHATLVERDRRLARRLQDEVERLGLSGRVSVRHADVATVVGSPVGFPPFDLVVVDPPYRDAQVTEQVAHALVAGGFLGPGAVLVSERLRTGEGPTPVRWPPDLQLDATRTYGQTVVEFFVHRERQ